jgi:LCP family protein required for cell wall assembly
LLAFLSAGFYFLWNSSFFGRKLPNFLQEGTRVVAISGAEITPEFTFEVPLVTPLVSASPIVLSTPTPQPEDIKPVCGQKEPMTFLVLGIDDHEQSDVIRIVRVDFIEKRVLVLSIPRDFWVSIPGLDAYGITESRINAAYGYGEYFMGVGQGIVESSATIYQNYGVTFDRYVVFHFSNFTKMIDAVGGLDIVLDAPIGAYGTTGTTHLDGKTALEYAWNRDADNDSYRVLRQSAIIRALFEKMRQPENITKLPGLGLKMLADKSVITDLSISDITTYVCMARELSGSSLILKDIPGDMYTPAYTIDGRYIDVPSQEVRTYIQSLVINGNY